MDCLKEILNNAALIILHRWTFNIHAPNLQCRINTVNGIENLVPEHLGCIENNLRHL
jgi:hypothetical protein